MPCLMACCKVLSGSRAVALKGTKSCRTQGNSCQFVHLPVCLSIRPSAQARPEPDLGSPNPCSYMPYLGPGRPGSGRPELGPGSPDQGPRRTLPGPGRPEPGSERPEPGHGRPDPSPRESTPGPLRAWLRPPRA